MSSTNPLPVAGATPIFLCPFSPVWLSTQQQLEFPGGLGVIGIMQTNQSLTVQRSMMCGLTQAGGGQLAVSPSQQSALLWGLSRGFVMWDPGGSPLVLLEAVIEPPAPPPEPAIEPVPVIEVEATPAATRETLPLRRRRTRSDPE